MIPLPYLVAASEGLSRAACRSVTETQIYKSAAGTTYIHRYIH